MQQSAALTPTQQDTVKATATLPFTRSETTLFEQLHKVLSAHPAGRSVRLVYAPDGPALAPPGEVLVQRADPTRNALELHPTGLNDLAPGDTLHATQTISITDPAFGVPAATNAAASYCKINGSHSIYT